MWDEHYSVAMETFVGPSGLNPREACCKCGREARYDTDGTTLLTYLDSDAVELPLKWRHRIENHRLGCYMSQQNASDTAACTAPSTANARYEYCEDPHPCDSCIDGLPIHWYNDGQRRCSTGLHNDITYDYVGGNTFTVYNRHAGAPNVIDIYFKTEHGQRVRANISHIVMYAGSSWELPNWAPGLYAQNTINHPYDLDPFVKYGFKVYYSLVDTNLRGAHNDMADSTELLPGCSGTWGHGFACVSSTDWTECYSQAAASSFVSGSLSITANCARQDVYAIRISLQTTDVPLQMAEVRIFGNCTECET